jgi:cytidine deaminase
MSEHDSGHDEQERDSGHDSEPHSEPDRASDRASDRDQERRIDDAELIGHAERARERAYTPYSHYQVGAALLAGGTVHSGANIENASYGLTICAERVAVASALMAGARDIEAVAVVTASSLPAAPCGMCLQTLREFTTDPRALRVILANTAGERRDFTLAELLPHGFDKSQLTGRDAP